MNFAVINLKKIKHFLIIVVILVTLFGFTEIMHFILKIQFPIFKLNKEYSILKYIEYSISFFNIEENQQEQENNILENIIKISIFNSNSRTIENDKSIENINTESTASGESVITEKVEENNIATYYTDIYNGVEIKNGTGYNLTDEILNPNPNITNFKDIIIFHTHTCESYTPSNQYNYEMTGNYRTTDLNYTVARVGTELTNNLKNKGFNVIHDTTYHDYPSYSGSYTRSLETVTNILQNTNAQMIIDLHRDALGNMENYGPTVKINGEYVSQLMFVIGTDEGGLEHPDWVQNLKFAVKIQEKANKMYPGLFRPINLTSSRYNQHTAYGASIIEVGATGNTLEQCLLSMQYLANVLEEVLK